MLDCVNHGPSRHAPPAQRTNTALVHAETQLDSGRQSGVLLHPTSLPNGWGIGNLGREAYAFIDLLQEKLADLPIWADYLRAANDEDIHWSLIRLALSSVQRF
jgi:hypothetical protein